MSAASRPPRPRALFVAALLLLTLALAGANRPASVSQFPRSQGHSRARVARLLAPRAARFAQRTEMAVYYHAFWPALDALSRAKGRATRHRASGAEPTAGEQRTPRGRLPQARAPTRSIRLAGWPAGNGGWDTLGGRAPVVAGHPARAQPHGLPIRRSTSARSCARLTGCRARSSTPS